MENRAAQMTSLFKQGVPVKEIAARFGVQNPAVWKALRRTGALPPYQPKADGKGGRPRGGGKPGYTARRLAAQADAIAAREARENPEHPGSVPSREPCFFCGVRGDIGCEHNSGWAA